MMNHKDEAEALRQELYGLFQYINKVRDEIAAIERDADDVRHFESMSDQLDAIINATEDATDSIMSAVEDTDKTIRELKKTITDADQIALLDEITKNGQDVFEACSFQDITGQRVTKIAKSVTYVEKRVSALMDIWGKEELAKIEIKNGEEEKTEDEKLLNGPQLAKENSISQDEIDALFN